MVKPEVATVRMSFRKESNRFKITLEDDGKGIDPKRIKEKVIEVGIKKEDDLGYEPEFKIESINIDSSIEEDVENENLESKIDEENNNNLHLVTEKSNENLNTNFEQEKNFQFNNDSSLKEELGTSKEQLEEIVEVETLKDNSIKEETGTIENSCESSNSEIESNNSKN